MITLSTGVPGAGKTLNTLELVEKECQGRTIYYRGIADLKLGWVELSDEDAHKWYEMQDGSVFVFDEVQQLWPNMAANKNSPESVTKLDTHRHRGFDFYLITQKPTLLDFRARGFVGRHYHYERSFNRNGTRQIEFQRAVNDPTDYHTRQEGQIKRISFNKEFYDKYKSAEVHTHKPRIPKAAIYFALTVCAVGALGFYIVNSISARSGGDDPALAQLDNQPGITDIMQAPASEQFQSAEQYAMMYTPRVADIPLSAPAYDELTKVKTYPRPQCIMSLKTQVCRCYTQTANPLEISQQTCMRIVDGGWFDPYAEEGEAERPALAAAAPPKPPTEPPPREIIYLDDSTDYGGARQAL